MTFLNRLGTQLKRPLEEFLGFFYPQVCQLCRDARATAPEGYVCAACRQDVSRIEPPCCRRCGRWFAGEISADFECGWCREKPPYFDSAQSAVIFEGAVREVLHRYKYQRALWFEPLLVQWLHAGLQDRIQPADWDSLVPVPLHRARLREREFNQAELLARHLGRRVGLPVLGQTLERVTNTRSQTRLSRNDRAENMRNAFRLRDDVAVTGQRILLFDDVMTTGATTNECARVLLAHGASRVGVCTLAHGK